MDDLKQMSHDLPLAIVELVMARGDEMESLLSGFNYPHNYRQTTRLLNRFKQAKPSEAVRIDAIQLRLDSGCEEFWERALKDGR